MQCLLRLGVCAAIAASVWVMLPPVAGAVDLDRSRLKTGMTLTEVIAAFGQPIRVEWVNLKGTAILFLFYESEDCRLCVGPADTDVLTQEDGRTVLPLGFVTERLADWGGQFYQQAKFPRN